MCIVRIEEPKDLGHAKLLPCIIQQRLAALRGVAFPVHLRYDAVPEVRRRERISLHQADRSDRLRLRERRRRGGLQRDEIGAVSIPLVFGEKTGPDPLPRLVIRVDACFAFGREEQRGVVELDEERAVLGTRR